MISAPLVMSYKAQEREKDPAANTVGIKGEMLRSEMMPVLSRTSHRDEMKRQAHLSGHPCSSALAWYEYAFPRLHPA
jgi:hypothetical protein